MQYNPYDAPQVPPPAPDAYGDGVAQPWQVGDVLGQAWEAFKKNFIVVFFAFVVSFILLEVPVQAGQSIAKRAATPVPNPPSIDDLIANATQLYLHPAFLTGQILGQLLGILFFVGLTRIYLASVRGQTPTFGMLFSGFDRFLPVLACQMLTGLIVTVGLLCFVVPGVILACGLMAAPFYVVDAKMGPIAAMGASWRATSGQRGAIFVYYLACFGITLGAAIACCLPLAVALPLIGLSSALVFARISGRGPAAPPAGPQAGYWQPPPQQGGYGGGYGGGGLGPPQ